MPLKYSNLTFDELIRTLRDDDSPTVRMLALRADLEIEETHADYLAEIQSIEIERDAIQNQLYERIDVISALLANLPGRR